MTAVATSRETRPSHCLPYALCPKRRGSYPSPPTRGWSFPPLSIKLPPNFNFSI
ncbi:MAG: hypothetical protein ACRAVC_25865 [Trichormus sp.]